MSEIMKRRRWKWYVLAAVVLVGLSPFLWRLRPLTADERSLIGTWREVRSGVYIQFTADRRFSGYSGASIEQSGTWRLSPGHLTMIHDGLPFSWSWRDVLPWLQGTRGTPVNHVLKFTGTTEMSWDAGDELEPIEFCRISE